MGIDPQNQVDMLLLSEISRLGRSTLEILKALDILHTHKVCGVLDNEGMFVGIITIDDAIDVLTDESTEVCGSCAVQCIRPCAPPAENEMKGMIFVQWYHSSKM